MHNIISWNINSAKSKLPFLQQLIQNLSPTVLCLQETKLDPIHQYKLKNYSIYRKDQVSTGHAKGGVLIAVTNSLYSEHINVNSPFQAIAVKVHLHIPITVCSVYLHHKDTVSKTSLRQLINQLPTPYILTGDFNGHNTIWGSTSTDPRGAILEDFIDSNNLIILNTGSPTRFDAYSGSFTSIDLSICSPSLATHLQWSISEDLHSSDHFPQIIHIQSPTNNYSQFSQKWCLSRADWNHFSQTVDLSDVYNCTSANSMVDILTTSIITAALSNIPLSSPSSQRKCRAAPWWNNCCEKAIKRKRQLLRKLKKNPSPKNLTDFKIARAQARRIVNESKRQSWRDYISSINSSTPASLLWTQIRRINRKCPYDPISAIKNANGELTTSPDSIAETFAEHYYKTTQLNTPVTQILPIHTTDICPHEESLNSPIRLDEVIKAIRHQKNSAPGPDRIHPMMLKKLSRENYQAITHLFNHIWDKHDFPTQWREAHIIPIKKPNKDKTLPCNYRPISLTNAFCKILEKILVQRLHVNLEERKLLNQYQCGFRPGRSTTDNLLYLQQEILLGFERKEQTTCIFFDIEKAFDRLWPSSILKALHNLEYRGNIIHFVHNFLSRRIFRVKIGNTVSLNRCQETGTPQGSVLSPLLFIIVMNSISSIIQHPVQHLLYADDLAVFIRHKYDQTAATLLQNNINQIATWGQQHGLTFAPTKTQVVYFTRKHQPWQLDLTIYDQYIHQTPTARFLGLLFDSKLRWTQHIAELKKKCHSRLSILKVLNGRAWGSDKKCLLRLYKVYIRSILNYGCIIYSSASTSVLNRLNTIQNQALRIASGAFITSPISSIHAETTTIPLPAHRNMQILSYYFKLQSQSKHINLYRAVTQSQFSSHCSRLINQYHIDAAQVRTLPSTCSIKRLLLKYITSHVQTEWSNGPPNKLRCIKPNWELWKTSSLPQRKSEKIITRIRIGHCYATHYYLFDKLAPPPICNTCNTPLTIEHLLNYCVLYSSPRTQIYGDSPYPILESLYDSIENVKKIISFVSCTDIRI